jgi:translation initiation factor IF-3
MNHLHGFVTTAQALRYVFLHRPQIKRYSFHIYQFLQSDIRFRSLHYARTRTAAKTAASAQSKTGIIQNEDIRADTIQLVNENGSLDPPERTADVLRSLQRNEYALVQVSPGGVNQPPVCKILSKRMMREQEKAKAKATHSSKMTTKQIELNWAIDPHDLSHRLKQLLSFLDKGRKVEITLTRKKGKRAPTVEEVNNLMDSVMDTIEEANAMQVKPMEGQPGKHVLIIATKKGT